MEKPQFTVAERLREALNIRGKTQADLVRETGIDKGSISHYLSGRYEPKQKAIYKLAQALSVNESWLLGYNVPMERTPVQKRNDELVVLVQKMRNDPEFFEVVSKLAKLPADKIASIKPILEVLGSH